MDQELVSSKPSLIRFLLVNGILLFGIPVALVTGLVRAVTATIPWLDYLFSTPVLVSLLVQAIVSGLVFGIVIWFRWRRA